MPPSRRLTLRKETLAALTEPELRAVVGALSGATCGYNICISDDGRCVTVGLCTVVTELTDGC